MNVTFKNLLESKKIAPLLITQFFAAFNDNFFKNALAVLITYKVINISPFRPEIIVTIIGGLFILPSFIFSAFAGQLADKYEKSLVLKLIKFCEIPIAFLATYGFMVNSLAVLLSALFLIAVQFAMFSPAKYSFLPERLQEDELIAGNGLLDASTFIAILIGTLAGGATVLVGANALIVIGIFMSIVAIASWIISLYIPKGSAAAPKLKIDYNIFRSTLAIIRDASKGQRIIFLAILGASWFWLLGFIVLSQSPIFVSEILGASSGVVTLFLALFTIGIAAGSMLCNKLMRNELNVMYIPGAVFGMSIFLFDCVLTANKHYLGVNPSVVLLTLVQFLSHTYGWRIAIDLFLLAVCGGVYIVPIYVIMQSTPKRELVSRIIAANNIMNAVFMTAGMVVVWVLHSLHFSLITIFYILVIANTFAAIYVCKLIPDEVVKSFCRWFFRTFFQIKITGLNNIKNSEGPYLVIANHYSLLDPLVIAAFFPRKLVFAINRDIAKTFLVRMVSGLVRLYPMDPTNPMATKGLINELKVGNHVMIFPEGRITNTGTLMKVYDGPGLIALKSGAKILPIRIDGSQYSLFSYLKHRVKRRLFPKISMIIMPAQKIDLAANLQGRERRHHVANCLYDLMTNLLFVTTNCDRTLFAKLLEARKIHGKYKPIIMDIERKPISYQRLITVAFAFAFFLRRISERASMIGILLPNSTATMGLFCGCQAVARIPVMLNYTSGELNLRSAIKASNIKTIFTSHKFIAYMKLEALMAALQEHTTVVYLENWQQNLSLFAKLRAKLLANIPTLVYHHWFVSADSEDPAVVIFTSGSEGSPKGVALSHKNLLANCAQLVTKIDFNAQDLIFNALPNFHSFGLTGGMLLPVLHGVKSFYFPNPLQYRVIPEMIYDLNATMMFGTDTFLQGYARFAHPYDFYSLRYVFAGAEKLRDDTRKIWSEKFGIRILEGYGATEAAPIISMNTPMHNVSGTVGRFLPGIEYRLLKVDGVHDGYKLFVAGANIALGYYTLQEPGKLEYFADKWHDTGDIVSLDDEGYIKILGRLKRFAKIAGEMISLTAVEEIAIKSWPESVVAALYFSDAKKGEKIVLVTSNKHITREAFAKACLASGGNELMVPREIILVDKIPLLGSGKINYVELQEQVAAGFNRDHEAVANRI